MDRAYSKKTGLCECKSVSVSVENAAPRDLSFDLNAQQIALQMRKNKNYTVNYFSGDLNARISRDFGNVRYEFRIEHYRNAIISREYIGFNIDTELIVKDASFPIRSRGERCITPNYILKENVFTMINDLPLTEQQKNEMKQHVRVMYVADILRIF
jgi:hypothetical protein